MAWLCLPAAAAERATAMPARAVVEEVLEGIYLIHAAVIAVVLAAGLVQMAILGYQALVAQVMHHQQARHKEVTVAMALLNLAVLLVTGLVAVVAHLLMAVLEQVRQAVTVAQDKQGHLLQMGMV